MSSDYFVKFIGYQASLHSWPDHIVRALVSAKEVKFLGDWSPTFGAVREQECKSPEAERVVTATRDSWRLISEELDAHAKSGNKSPDEMSTSQHHARAWCEAIRVRVLGKDIRYFGLS